jgi:serine/threonine protein kinase
VANDALQNAPVAGGKKRFPRNFGRYILDKSLSRGGMGEVYLAVARGPNKWCVIKTIRGDLTGDDEFIGRFADEAKIMVRISHDNIIRVFDAGKVEYDYYIAMEYVHGRDLGDVLDRAYERGEPMPTQLGLYVASYVLRGLHYAHRLTDEQGRHMGLVHRDISPQNVLIGFDGSIKIIDFGLARTDLLPARTQGALAVGKYGYMSPEQARHEDIDGRADIYSTGVMLFEVFTGDRLVDEQDQATLWQRVLSPKHRPPRSVIPNLPKEIDELVMTAVSIEPEKRFGDCNKMLEFVESLRTEESNRETFQRYLRYLYPKLDFTPPPVPNYSSEIGWGTERSIIIATSREGALSVFGRGELAIEGTTQINAEELRKAFQARDDRREARREREERRDEKKNFEVTTDANIPPPLGEAQPRRDNGMAPPSARLIDDTLDPPTQISRLPPNEKQGLKAPVIAQVQDEDSDMLDDDQTIQAAPVRGLGRFGQYRDDEMTVMMDAPPRPSADDLEDIGDEGDAPTRLARMPKEQRDQKPSKAGRAIRERVSAQDPSERADKPRNTNPPPQSAQPTQPIREAREPAPPKPNFVAHKGTVGPAPSVQDTRPTQKAAEPIGYLPVGQAEMTEPERDQEAGIGIVFPAMIIVGILVLAVVLVWFFFHL